MPRVSNNTPRKIWTNEETLNLEALLQEHRNIEDLSSRNATIHEAMLRRGFECTRRQVTTKIGRLLKTIPGFYNMYDLDNLNDMFDGELDYWIGYGTDILNSATSDRVKDHWTRNIDNLARQKEFRAHRRARAMQPTPARIDLSSDTSSSEDAVLREVMLQSAAEYYNPLTKKKLVEEPKAPMDETPKKKVKTTFKCPVCLEDDLDDLYALPCTHAIHGACYNGMKSNGCTSCPICKKEVGRDGAKKVRFG